MDRRTAVQALLGASCALLSKPGLALPRTVRVVVPSTAGGTVGTQARLIARELVPILGVPVVVDNKPGAAGLIGAAEVARSPGDGSVLLYTGDYVVTQSPHAVKKKMFDPFKDLKPIASVAGTAPILIVSKQAPFQTLGELIAFSKTNPGKVSFGSWVRARVLIYTAKFLLAGISYR